MTSLLGFSTTADAIDPNRAISQYVRTEWTAETGFPGGAVSAIAQTPDGYLWIGTEKGLVRFDGVTFKIVQPSSQPSFTNIPVLGLLTDTDSSLWASLYGPTVVRYPHGDPETATADIILPNAMVTAMGHTTDGGLLIASTRRGVMAYRSRTLTPLLDRALMPASFVIAVAQTPNGDVWLGTRDVGLYRLSHGQLTAVTQGVPDRKINALLPGSGQDLWIGTDNGVVRWNGSSITTDGVPPTLARVQALAMIRDRDGNIWIASGAGGLLRVNGGVAVAASARNNADITSLFEDREGNLWIGTTHGLLRLRDAAFTTFTQTEGLPSENGGAVHSDADRRVWFAPSSGGLYAFRDGGIQRIAVPGLGNDVIYSIAGGGDQMWLGRQQGGLTRLRLNATGGGVSANTYTPADGLAQDTVYAVYQSRDGAVWAGTLSGGVSRFADGRFVTYTTTNGLASNSVTAIAESATAAREGADAPANATIWIGTSNGLSAFSNGKWKSYYTMDGLPSDMIGALVEEDGRLWIGTAIGLAWLDADGRIHRPSRMLPLQDQILGIEVDRRNGALWISTSNRILRVDRDKLLNGTLTDADIRDYGIADGLLGTEGIKRFRNIATDTRGRLWIAQRHGLSTIDPQRAAASLRPALVHVTAMAADGTPIDIDAGEAVRIPAGKQRVTLGFVGLSLSVPERVRYRYKLEGFDRTWSDPVASREAVYTNLGPGPYRFRVMASNSDGLWSDVDTSIPFTIDPAFWQTRWFQAAIIFAVCGLIAGLYRIRVQRMTRQLNVRFEERLAERTRIAQEIHDTLLQGFLSASMQLHVASDQMPADSPARPTIDRVLTLMGRVIEEGRNAVRGLRTPASGVDDLEEAFHRAQQELGVTGTSEFRVIVEGRPRPLHPVVRDEVHRLGREALMNAFYHASARHIEVELEYAAHHLRMLVRDDGVGIDPQILQSGRQGHWGLSGMRERAERMGARLRLWSRAGAGTEVELSVPGHVAFVTPSARWFARWRSRRGP